MQTALDTESLPWVALSAALGSTLPESDEPLVDGQQDLFAREDFDEILELRCVSL